MMFYVLNFVVVVVVVFMIMLFLVTLGVASVPERRVEN